MDRWVEATMYKTGCGTHRFKAKWFGKWTNQELINVIDNRRGAYTKNPTEKDLQCSNFGGTVTAYPPDITGITEGIVEVYYD